QSEKALHAAERPPEMLPAASAYGDAPAAAGEPGVLVRGGTEDGAAGGGPEAAEAVLDARGVGARVHVAAGNGNAFRVLGDGMTARPATQVVAAARVGGLGVALDGRVESAGRGIEAINGGCAANLPAARRAAARPDARPRARRPLPPAQDADAAADH